MGSILDTPLVVREPTDEAIHAAMVAAMHCDICIGVLGRRFPVDVEPFRSAVVGLHSAHTIAERLRPAGEELSRRTFGEGRDLDDAIARARGRVGVGLVLLPEANDMDRAMEIG